VCEVSDSEVCIGSIQTSNPKLPEKGNVKSQERELNWVFFLSLLKTFRKCFDKNKSLKQLSDQTVYKSRQLRKAYTETDHKVKRRSYKEEDSKLDYPSVRKIDKYKTVKSPAHKNFILVHS